MIGFPPAGGWVTLHVIIKPTPKPTAKGIKIYSGRGTYKQSTPTPEVSKCPKKIFFGCAKGLSGYPYNKTIVDPKDAIKNIPNSVLYVNKVNAQIVMKENIPANKDFFKFDISIFIKIIYTFLLNFSIVIKGNNKHSFLAKFFLFINFENLDHFFGNTFSLLSKNLVTKFLSSIISKKDLLRE